MRSLYEDTYNNIIESQILRDADGLSAALALDRILGVWLTNKETFLNRHISIDERIELIKANKYLMTDGGDAINDLIRQFLRRDRKYYLTRDAGDIIEKKSGSDELEKFLRDPEVRKNIKNAPNSREIGSESESRKLGQNSHSNTYLPDPQYGYQLDSNHSYGQQPGDELQHSGHLDSSLSASRLGFRSLFPQPHP